MEWWHQALIAVGAALIGGVIFHLLQLRRLGSAARERLSRAHKELVDTIEMDVINEKEISRDAISRLINALSRAHKVDLGPVCTPVSILEDVELRLQTNRYLDAQKKETSMSQLRAAIQNMQIPQVPIPEAPTPVWQPEELNQLRTAISAGDKEQALEITERLSKQPYIPEMKLSQLIRASETRQAWLISTVIAIVAAGIALSIMLLMF